MIKVKTIALVLFLALSIGGYSQESIPTSKGFHGFFKPGYGFLHFRNNQVAQFMSYQLNEQQISSIHSVPDAQNTSILTLPMEIGYTIVPYKTHIFIGNQIEDLIRFDVSQQIGIKQRFKKLGVMQVGLLYTGLPTKVWEDPFITGSDRIATRRSAFGVLLALEQIWSTSFTIQYSYRDVKVNKELSGHLLNLDAGEDELLRRNGDMHRLNIRYRFFFKQKHRIIPMFEIVRDKRQGDARSRLTYDMTVNYVVNLKEKHKFIANARLGQALYDKENPVYGIRQKDIRYGLSASLFVSNHWGLKMFGNKAFHFVFSGAYNYVDANIEFYQQRGILLQMGIFTRW